MTPRRPLPPTAAVAALLLAACAPSALPGPPRLAALAPPEALGWRPEGQDGLFDRDTLHELIDGGAEVYRSFGVRAVLSRRYAKAGAPDLSLDLFDMGTPADAFGAFHHDLRDGPSAGVGRESERSGGNLSFWKDRYFVSVLPLGPGDEAARAVLALGEAVARAIPGDGPPPALVGLLPAEGLVASQVHYFHDPWVLGRHHDGAPAEDLALGPDTEGLIARYRGSAGDVRLALILVRYPSEGGAEAARARVAARHPEARRLGAVVALALDAPSTEEAARLLDAVERRAAGGGR